MILQFHDSDKALGMAHHGAVALCVWPRYVSRGSRLYSARSRGPEDEGACPPTAFDEDLERFGLQKYVCYFLFFLFIQSLILLFDMRPGKKAVFNKSGIDWMN